MKLSSNRTKLLIIFLGILIILSFNFWQSGVRNFFYSISEPHQKTFWGTGDSVSDFFEGLSGGRNLKQENEELKHRNQELLNDIVSLKKLEEENKMLKEALGIGLQEDFKLTIADLVSKDVSEDYILINKGSEDGLAIGMPVITEREVLLGKISEVYKSFSRVILISNVESSFPAEVQEQEGVAGIVKGEGNFQISLEKVPRDKEIREGSIVITTSLGGVFPKKLLIGEIRKIQRSDIKPFQKVEISPFFDLEELKTVFIIIKY